MGGFRREEQKLCCRLIDFYKLVCPVVKKTDRVVEELRLRALVVAFFFFLQDERRELRTLLRPRNK